MTAPILFFGPGDHLVRCPERWHNIAQCRRVEHDGPHLYDLMHTDPDTVTG